MKDFIKEKDFTINGKYLITYYIDAGSCLRNVKEVYTEISEIRKQINRNQSFI